MLPEIIHTLNAILIDCFGAAAVVRRIEPGRLYLSHCTRSLLYLIQAMGVAAYCTTRVDRVQRVFRVLFFYIFLVHQKSSLHACPNCRR